MKRGVGSGKGEARECGKMWGEVPVTRCEGVSWVVGRVTIFLQRKRRTGFLKDITSADVQFSA